MFIYFLSLVIKKFDAIISLLMRRVWETKHLFFWPKLVEPLTWIHCMSTMSCTCTCSYFLFLFFTCNNFLVVWHSIVLLPLCEYIYIFFIALLGVGIEIKILYFCTWEKHNVFMSDFPYLKLLKVPLSCFMDKIYKACLLFSISS